MKKIIVNDRETLDALYKDSAITLVGFAPTDKNLEEFVGWIKEFTKFKREDIYIIEGGVMNRHYALTGLNAYPETDCTLVAVKLSDLEKPLSLMIPRFQIGGRWFDDIVDNNARREQEKKQ